MSGGARRDLAVVAGGAALLAFSWREALRPELPAWESDTFDLVNGMHEVLRATWPIMQLGSFPAIPVVALLVDRRLRDRPRAVAVAVAGGIAYGGAKVVKRRVRRPRPFAFRPEMRAREQARGLGFPSGHAAESTAMALAAAPALPRPLRWLVIPAVGTVSFGRVYHGAHLPHDIVGGVGLGAMVGGVVNLVTGAVQRAGRPEGGEP